MRAIKSLLDNIRELESEYDRGDLSRSELGEISDAVFTLRCLLDDATRKETELFASDLDRSVCTICMGVAA